MSVCGTVLAGEDPDGLQAGLDFPWQWPGGLQRACE